MTPPPRFSALQQECQAVRTQAGLLDDSTWGAMRIAGADRAAFLHNLLSNDITQLAPGSGCEAALLTANGKLLADLLVLADTEAHWLLAPRARVETVLTTLHRYLITEDVRLTDETSRMTLLALQGARSLPILRKLFGEDIAFAHPVDHAVRALGTTSVRLIAHSITGEPGALVMADATTAASVREEILLRGRELGVLPVGAEALNALRIEAGIPWYGVDMDETTLLPETGLERRAVSDTKGCYVGQEIVARLDTYGSVSRKLIGLVCEESDVPQANDLILSGSSEAAASGHAPEPLGEVTSGCFSPTLQRAIALGYVKRPHYRQIGSDVVIARGCHELRAKLASLPFVASDVR